MWGIPLWASSNWTVSRSHLPVSHQLRRPRSLLNELAEDSGSPEQATL